MKLKKGFTLAEILIVLVVIGVLAVLTVPSLSKGVTESQYKAAYKKAYNTIANVTAMEKASGQLYTAGTAKNADELFDVLVKSVAVKAFIAEKATDPSVATNDILNLNAAFRGNDKYLSQPPKDENRYKHWIITDDNVAYLIIPTTNSCGSKLQIGASQVAKTSRADLEKQVCFTIWVDVNGVEAGPNKTIEGGAQGLASSAKIPALIEDQYPIYIGNDGATPGNNIYTITGRIASDIK